VELSGAKYGYRASAGFEGILERGVEDVIARVVGNEEAINFSVISGSGEVRGWFILARSSFKTATLVRGPLGDALVIRAGLLDVTIAPVSAGKL
jgi:hypothetical protein